MHCYCFNVDLRRATLIFLTRKIQFLGFIYLYLVEPKYFKFLIQIQNLFIFLTFTKNFLWNFGQLLTKLCFFLSLEYIFIANWLATVIIKISICRSVDITIILWIKKTPVSIFKTFYIMSSLIIIFLTISPFRALYKLNVKLLKAPCTHVIIWKCIKEGKKKKKWEQKKTSDRLAYMPYRLY